MGGIRLCREHGSGHTRIHSYGPGVMNRTNAAWERPVPIGAGLLRLIISNQFRMLGISSHQI